jgi:hypothetical protein
VEEKKSLKSTSMVKSKKDLAIVKRQLAELDGFGLKLEVIVKNLKQKDDELSKTRKEVDIDTLKCRLF